MSSEPIAAPTTNDGDPQHIDGGSSKSSEPLASETYDNEPNSLAPQEVDESSYLSDVPLDSEDLDLTHCRLENMQSLNLGRFKQLAKLGLRQNLFSFISPNLADLSTTLVELDLYDNRIADIFPVHSLANLKVLDLSFNKIKSIPKDTFKNMHQLEELFFVANQISTIENLDGLQLSLTNLELGANKIRHISGLDQFINMKQLWLGKNKIASLCGLQMLESLTLLSIQSNRIISLEGIQYLFNLEELYLSHNGILEITEHLGPLTKLKVLDLCNNRISVLENIGHLTQLNELWISNNRLDNWDHIQLQTRNMPDLQTIYLEGNPLQVDNRASYRLKVKTMVPQVKQVDAQYIRD